MVLPHDVSMIHSRVLRLNHPTKPRVRDVSPFFATDMRRRAPLLFAAGLMFAEISVITGSSIALSFCAMCAYGNWNLPSRIDAAQSITPTIGEKSEGWLRSLWGASGFPLSRE
jgi:hypothetical protein